jgi:hypothetical protein
MKNRKKTLTKSILPAVMLTAMMSYATNGLDVNPNNDIKKTSFTINNVREGNQLTIKDLNGIILYKEKIEKSGTYSKGFDLTSLPSGSYVFELQKDLEIKSFPFTVNKEKVVFNGEETIIYKPFVTQKGNHLYVSKLALNEEPLEIKIYRDSELIYSEEIKNTKTIEKVYKLSTSGRATNNYTMVLKSNDREYFEYITL